eukprot:5556591-Alexandrium_andersonii.AAC.2
MRQPPQVRLPPETAQRLCARPLHFTSDASTRQKPHRRGTQAPSRNHQAPMGMPPRAPSDQPLGRRDGNLANAPPPSPSRPFPCPDAPHPTARVSAMKSKRKVGCKKGM